MSEQTRLRDHTYTKPVPAVKGQYLFKPLNSTKWRLLDVVGGDVPGDILNVKGTPVEEMHGEWRVIVEQEESDPKPPPTANPVERQAKEDKSE
jgi:hypothetical protein